MNGLRFSVLITAAMLLLGACSSTHYVQIRHPLHVGQVDPNSVPFHARRHESPRGLPAGSLVDEAQLTEVTPERVCLHTTLWTLDEVDPGRGIYQNYNIALLSDQEGVEVSNATIQLEQPITQAYNGFISRREQVGTRRVCRRYERTRNGDRVCRRWGDEPVYRNVRYPHVWQVTDHPATLCFPNGGFITPSTTRLALEVDGRGAGSMIFEWQFVSAVANTAPAQQQQAQ